MANEIILNFRNLHIGPYLNMFSKWLRDFYFTLARPRMGSLAHTFWGFLNISLRASGAQLGLVDGKA